MSMHARDIGRRLNRFHACTPRETVIRRMACRARGGTALRCRCEDLHRRVRVHGTTAALRVLRIKEQL